MPRKKRYYFIVIIIMVMSIVLLVKKPSEIKQTKIKIPSPTVQAVLKSENKLQAVSEVKKSIFVPYWALGQDNLSIVPYDKVYYFGVSADKNGIVQEDQGYKTLERLNCPNAQECVLVLRMLEQSTSLAILERTDLQQKIITETLQLAQEHFFSGVALDLEISGLVQADVKEQINTFVQLFSTSAKKDYKTFSFIVYGDVFYRNRPYDIEFIGNYSDEVMIMAYDLQKSYGEPGPNFNFSDIKTYGYDFQTMVANFKRDVDPQKITVIFGMYGYDWTLNNQETPLKRAEAITVNQVKNLKSQMSNVKATSQISNFQEISLGKAKEKKIEYEDAEGQKHIIYFEDEESATVKTQYLKEQGIGNISFWAFSYF